MVVGLVNIYWVGWDKIGFFADINLVLCTFVYGSPVEIFAWFRLHNTSVAKPKLWNDAKIIALKIMLKKLSPALTAHLWSALYFTWKFLTGSSVDTFLDILICLSLSRRRQSSLNLIFFSFKWHRHLRILHIELNIIL